MIELSFWERLPGKARRYLPHRFQGPAGFTGALNESVQKAGQSGSNANRINLTLQLDNIDFRPSKWPSCPVFWTLIEDFLTASPE